MEINKTNSCFWRCCPLQAQFWVWNRTSFDEVSQEDFLLLTPLSDKKFQCEFRTRRASPCLFTFSIDCVGSSKLWESTRRYCSSKTIKFHGGIPFESILIFSFHLENHLFLWNLLLACKIECSRRLKKMISKMHAQKRRKVWLVTKLEIYVTVRGKETRQEVKPPFHRTSSIFQT